MPGDTIRLASLFFDTASRTRKRKRNRRSKYPKALRYAKAEVNTIRWPYVRLLPDKWNTRTYYWVPWTDTHSGVLLLFPSTVWSVASVDALCHKQCPYDQIAHRSVFVLPPHHLSWISFGRFYPCWASYYPLPVSASFGAAAFTPLVCSFIVSFLSEAPVSTWKYPWYPSRLFSGSLAESNWHFLLHPYTALVLMRLINSYFFFLF